MRSAIPLCAVLAACLRPASADPSPATSTSDDLLPAVEWTAYGRDQLGSRLAPIPELNPGTVGRLRQAWVYRTGETDPGAAERRFESTPIVVDGTMYIITPLGRIIALDPATGGERWVWDGRVDPRLDFGDFGSRGVSTWLDPAAAAGAHCRRRIVAATIDARLVALDARDGRPCAGFGAGGIVDLRRGLRNAPFETEEYEVTSPPVIVGGVIVVGSAIADNNRVDAASGEVRAFDVRTGAARWSWDPVPQRESDPAWPSWESPSAHRAGAANAWSVLAADSARGLVIVPTSSPSPDYFGGERPGENRYGNSVVALRAATGEVVWHFQTVHHDLWDYDLASPPALVTLRRDGRPVDAVLQATKTGQLFVLDRASGAPIFPVEERPVPPSPLPDERAWPTQPFSSVAPLSPHRMTADEAWGATAEDRAACRAQVAALRNEGIFTPPSREGTLVVPSNVGGAHWGGLAYDPQHEIAVVPVNRVAAMVQLIPHGAITRDSMVATHRRLGDEYTRMRGTPYVMRRRILRAPGGLPCAPPPWGTLVGVSLRTGAKVWEVPLGSMSALAGRPLPGEWGSINLGGPVMTTGGVAFMAGTLDRSIRAFEVATGRELWRGELPTSARATPAVYRMGGRVYVVVATGGGEVFGPGDHLVAFRMDP
jgi:quinoprotein glucose dehydrogenase